jgi:cell division septal protein FtsQ
MRPQSEYAHKKISTHRLRTAKPKSPWHKWGILAGVLLIGFVVIMNTSWLTITTVVVEGNQRLAEPDIRAIVDQQFERRNVFGFSQRNLIALSKRQTVRQLAEVFPYTKFSINKDVPHTVRIKVKEPMVAALWRSSLGSWYINAEGVVVGPASTQSAVVTQDDELVILRDASGAEVQIGKSLITPTLIEFLSKLAEGIGAQTDLEIAEMRLDRPGADFVTVEAADGSEILFRVTDDPNVQINRLKVLLETKIKDSRVRYIDLRFGDKIFYR